MKFTGLVCLVTLVSCGSTRTSESTSVTSPTSFRPTTTAPTRTAPTSTSTTSSTTGATNSTSSPAIAYVFPFTDQPVSYGPDHHDYPAVDVFGCRATVVAPVAGEMLETRTEDRWPGSGNNPAYRGGLYVSLLGIDGVRYYFAHLASVSVEVGERVEAGTALGVMGQTGNAAQSACHTHFGISWTCPGTEWEVRRGEVWPQKYLDAWRAGWSLSPRDEIDGARAAHPGACDHALADPDAALA